MNEIQTAAGALVLLSRKDPVTDARFDSQHKVSKEKACVSIETSISTATLIMQHESYTINSEKAITWQRQC